MFCVISTLIPPMKNKPTHKKAYGYTHFKRCPTKCHFKGIDQRFRCYKLVCFQVTIPKKRQYFKAKATGE